MSKILTPCDIGTDLRGLDAAWSAPETFALIPDKVAKMDLDIARTIAELPPPFDTAHYGLLTSGTTGEPKLVFGSRERSEKLVRVLHEYQQSEDVAETIVLLPLTYCFSFVNQYLWARSHTRRLILTDGLSRPGELLSTLSDAENAMLCLIGSQVPLLLQYYAGRSFPGVIRVHFAGGRFPAERLDDVRTLFPNALIFNNYGCSEAMPRLTLRSAEAATDAVHVGWPLPGVELKTSDDGALLFRSPYGAVAQADRNGFRAISATDWVATGDLGHQVEGGHVELLARSSEVFKRHGEKVSIPTILGSINSVWSRSLGVYREADGAGEDGYVLVLSPQPAASEVREILLVLRNNYGRTQWPLRIESTVNLPQLSNGKIDQKALVEMSDLKQHWRQRI